MYQSDFQADIFFFNECFKVLLSDLSAGCFGKAFKSCAFVKTEFVVKLIKNTAQAVCADNCV